MFEFAQTNLQLYRQMEDLGYTAPEREQAAAAYRFLIPTFSGLYRGTEKPFIAHLVGTASILVANRAPMEWVLAALLHAVYKIGDFGFEPGTRHTTRKERSICRLIGKDANAIIVAYDALRWDDSSINHCVQHYQQLSEPVKAALALRLANLLEDLLDGGANYERGEKFEAMSSLKIQQATVALATTHSWPGLAQRLEQAFTAFNAGLTPVEPAMVMGYSKLVLPPSAHRNFLSTARGWLVRRLRYFKRRLTKP